MQRAAALAPSHPLTPDPIKGSLPKQSSFRRSLMPPSNDRLAAVNVFQTSRPLPQGHGNIHGTMEADGIGPRGQRDEKGDSMKKYVCDVCGYIYDPELGDPDGGIAPGTAFEDIPDDWVCPLCGVSKEDFSPID